MKCNYRNQPSCPKCKFVIWGKSYDWPRLYCNKDKDYSREWIEGLWDSLSDEELEEIFEYQEVHKVDINGICDEYDDTHSKEDDE